MSVYPVTQNHGEVTQRMVLVVSMGLLAAWMITQFTSDHRSTGSKSSFLHASVLQLGWVYIGFTQLYNIGMPLVSYLHCI
jgi:hypothetical protein